MEKINFGFTSLFWFHESKPGLIITVILTQLHYKGWKNLKGLQLGCTLVRKNKHRIYVRNEDSSGFSEQRKSIEPEFIQRCHPTFPILYILTITFLCHASLTDPFDPNSLYFNV